MTFSPQRFGERLRQLRGDLTLEELSLLSGVPVHTLRRYERGQNEKIDFADVVALGNALGLSPNQMAAIADLWVLPESEATQLGSEIQRALERLKNYMVGLSEREQARMITMLDLVMVVDRQQRQVEQQEPDQLLLLIRNR